MLNLSKPLLSHICHSSIVNIRSVSRCISFTCRSVDYCNVESPLKQLQTIRMVYILQNKWTTIVMKLVKSLRRKWSEESQKQICLQVPWWLMWLIGCWVWNPPSFCPNTPMACRMSSIVSQIMTAFCWIKMIDKYM